MSVIKAEPEWIYSVSSKRYRNTKTGRFIGQDNLVDLRNRYLEGEMAVNRDLAERLFNRKITIHDWEREMMTGIARTYTNLYVANRGGQKMMTPDDWDIIRGRVDHQHKTYLLGFKSALIDGQFAEDQIDKAVARMNMYTMSANQAFSLGRMAAYGIPELPAHPGDMSSECGSNDRCYWHIDEDESEWRCYWRTGSSNPCETCSERRGKWNPYRIAKG